MEILITEIVIIIIAVIIVVLHFLGISTDESKKKNIHIIRGEISGINPRNNSVYLKKGIHTVVFVSSGNVYKRCKSMLGTTVLVEYLISENGQNRIINIKKPG